MEKKQYSWGGSPYSHLNAKVIGERIIKLTKEAKNKLTPQIVVDDARPPSSPLHVAFEWSDKKAAEEYRLTQARSLIRSIRVTIEQSADKDTPKRMFVHVIYQEESGEEKNGEKQRYYTPVTIAMQNPDIRASILERALAELTSFRQKYAELQELAGVFSAIDEVIPSMEPKHKAA